MFNSFTSILSPALKEKLGIGPKKRVEPKNEERGSSKSPRYNDHHHSSALSSQQRRQHHIHLYNHPSPSSSGQMGAGHFPHTTPLPSKDCRLLSGNHPDHYHVGCHPDTLTCFKVRGSKPRLHHPIDQHGSSEARESSVQQGWKSPSRPPLQVLL